MSSTVSSLLLTSFGLCLSIGSLIAGTCRQAQERVIGKKIKMNQVLSGGSFFSTKSKKISFHPGHGKFCSSLVTFPRENLGILMAASSKHIPQIMTPPHLSQMCPLKCYTHKHTHKHTYTHTSSKYSSTFLKRNYMQSVR